jgi:uncharacterized protein with PQ loop repeat
MLALLVSIIGLILYLLCQLEAGDAKAKATISPLAFAAFQIGLLAWLLTGAKTSL